MGSLPGPVPRVGDEVCMALYKGTTHMMMLGTNNLETADVILTWVDHSVPSQGQERQGQEVHDLAIVKQKGSDEVEAIIRAAHGFNIHAGCIHSGLHEQQWNFPAEGRRQTMDDAEQELPVHQVQLT
jgi:hypothetical protein